ncbi:hypothetical protein PFISCL1PPCAC_19253, partial [Pristionchus fissidentatus]
EMKLLLLFSFLLISLNANFTFPEYEHFPIKEYHAELKYAAEISDTEQRTVSCVAFYCHFEDVEECKETCAELTSLIEKHQEPEERLVGSEEKEGIKHAARRPPFDLYANENECLDECLGGLSLVSMLKVCDKLCRIHFSFPNREKYERELRDFSVKYLADRDREL